MKNMKAGLRKEILNRLRKQPEDDKRVKEKVIKEQFLSSEEFLNNRVMMFYVSMQEEVDTWAMIEEAIDRGKTVVVPYSLKENNTMVPIQIWDVKKDLEKGVYGIYQPKSKEKNIIPLTDIEIVIVPGVAFDKENNRLGRGKGYYDNFLRKLPKKTVAIGLCFDFQIVKDLPTDQFDLPVHSIISN
jgi:5-formyltetrahydrofolate cyclo-ligase